MKNDRRMLMITAVAVVIALLLVSVPALARQEPERGRSLAEARVVLEQDLLALAGTGVVGIAHSEAEGEVIVFVEDEDAVSRVPPSYAGHVVRVEVTGTIESLSIRTAESPSGLDYYRQGEVRPLVGGTSLSAWVTKGMGVFLYAGTLGMVTYDNKILSNAHVIAMEPGTDRFLEVGTAIIQPGSGDGGRLSERVGELEAYIPIDFGSNAQNYADAAIGSVDTWVGASAGEQFGESGSYWIQGWSEVSKGNTVRKSGRTTGVTTGQIVHTNASVWVSYGDKSAYFVDQIVVSQSNWSFAAQGDSGSAVDEDGEFVGLVFGGSETHAVISKAEHIIAGLGIAVEPLEGWYSLTVSSTPGGAVTVPGEGMFVHEAGTVVDLVAEADEHFRFVRWTGDVETVGDVHDASTNVTMEGSYSVTASFELEEGWSSLNVSSTEGGSVEEPGEGVFIQEIDTVIDLVAEADQYYRFAEWTGDVDTVGDVFAAATNITMSASFSITAGFELQEGWYSLGISSTDGGSVTEPGEGVFIREAGTVVDLVADPEEGYQFVKWTGGVGKVGDVYAAATNVTMDSSYSITATFESWQPDPQVQLTIWSTSGGLVAEPGEGVFSFPLGTEVSLVAAPEDGYRFVVWSSEADTIANVSAASTTIIMDSSYSVRADFGRVSRCFIATAAYGTPMADEIQILRDFRDRYLITNPAGKAMVDLYYWLSPPIADFITEYPRLQGVVRVGLLPVVAAATVAVDVAQGQQTAIAGVMALILVTVAVWVLRRRSGSVQYA